MNTNWLFGHCQDVAEAFHQRIIREGYRESYQMWFMPAAPGRRGGLCILPSSEDLRFAGWLPVPGAMEGVGMWSKREFPDRLYTVARRLPVLETEK